MIIQHHVWFFSNVVTTQTWASSALGTPKYGSSTTGVSEVASSRQSNSPAKKHRRNSASKAHTCRDCKNWTYNKIGLLMKLESFATFTRVSVESKGPSPHPQSHSRHSHPPSRELTSHRQEIQPRPLPGQEGALQQIWMWIFTCRPHRNRRQFVYICRCSQYLLGGQCTSGVQTHASRMQDTCKSAGMVASSGPKHCPSARAGVGMARHAFKAYNTHGGDIATALETDRTVCSTSNEHVNISLKIVK